MNMFFQYFLMPKLYPPFILLVSEVHLCTYTFILLLLLQSYTLSHSLYQIFKLVKHQTVEQFTRELKAWVCKSHNLLVWRGFSFDSVGAKRGFCGLHISMLYLLNYKRSKRKLEFKNRSMDTQYHV